MRQGVIHIGAPHCGVKAVQAALGASRDTLASQGLVFSSVGRNQNFLQQLARFSHVFGAPGEDPRWQRPNVTSVLRRYRQAHDEANTVERGTYLLSAENLFSSAPKSVGVLKQMSEDMFPGTPVRILAYVRHPLAYALAEAAESVIAGRESIEAVDARAYEATQRKCLERFRSVFGDDSLIVRSYDEAVAGEGVVPDLLRALGHPQAIADLAPSEEEPLPPLAAVVAADTVNSALKSAPNEQVRTARTLKARLATRFKDAPFTLPKETLQTLRAAAAQEAAWLSSTFGVTLTEPTIAPREEVMPKGGEARRITRVAERIVQRATTAGAAPARAAKAASA